MKNIEQIKNKIEEFKIKKSKLEEYYKSLEDTDDKDMIDNLTDIDLKIYMLDEQIRLLSWVLLD